MSYLFDTFCSWQKLAGILSEDGCELNTVFDHNLGLGTRRGRLTPSDKEPATFWFTSPLVEATNNVAAGSHSQKGVGIWYIFPDEPIADCQGLGIFKKREAKSTPISRFILQMLYTMSFVLCNNLGYLHMYKRVKLIPNFLDSTIMLPTLTATAAYHLTGVLAKVILSLDVPPTLR